MALFGASGRAECHLDLTAMSITGKQREGRLGSVAMEAPNGQSEDELVVALTPVQLAVVLVAIVVLIILFRARRAG